MQADGFSAVCCGEPPYFRFLPIVYHLSTGGHIVDALRSIYNMSSSTRQPLYIYIKENRIHNNKREKSGQNILVERLS
jgi:hypothetical protein